MLPSSLTRLPRKVRSFVGRDVLRPSESRLEQALVQDRVLRGGEWGLGRLGELKERRVKVGVLDGQLATVAHIRRGVSGPHACRAPRI